MGNWKQDAALPANAKWSDWYTPEPFWIAPATVALWRNSYWTTQFGVGYDHSGLYWPETEMPGNPFVQPPNGSSVNSWWGFRYTGDGIVCRICDSQSLTKASGIVIGGPQSEGRWYWDYVRKNYNAYSSYPTGDGVSDRFFYPFDEPELLEPTAYSNYGFSRASPGFVSGHYYGSPSVMAGSAWVDFRGCVRPLAYRFMPLDFLKPGIEIDPNITPVGWVSPDQYVTTNRIYFYIDWEFDNYVEVLDSRMEFLNNSHFNSPGYTIPIANSYPASLSGAANPKPPFKFGLYEMQGSYELTYGNWEHDNEPYPGYSIRDHTCVLPYFRYATNFDFPNMSLLGKFTVSDTTFDYTFTDNPPDEIWKIPGETIPYYYTYQQPPAGGRQHFRWSNYKFHKRWYDYKYRFALLTDTWNLKVINFPWLYNNPTGPWTLKEAAAVSIKAEIQVQLPRFRYAIAKNPPAIDGQMAPLRMKQRDDGIGGYEGHARFKTTGSNPSSPGVRIDGYDTYR